MKELTIEEKAKRYDEAIKLAKDSFIYPDYPGFIRADIVFPELKESEDEKIRKALIDFFDISAKNGEQTNGVYDKDILVWLKKQGDKDKLIKELGEYKAKYTQEVLEKHLNSINNKDDERLRKTTITFLKDFAEQGYENAVECIDWLEKQDVQEFIDYNVELKKCLENPLYFIYKYIKFKERKSANKVESKFHKGDWITNDAYTCKVLSVTGKSYELHLYNDDYFHFGTDARSVDEQYHLWTINDAKDGDVLCVKYGNDEMPFIFTGKQDDVAYCALNSFGEFVLSIAEWLLKTSVLPATKKQRDLLFSKMKESGYEWDAEKKELKKITNNTYCSENCKGYQETGKCLADGECDAKRKYDNMLGSCNIEHIEHGKYYYCIKDYYAGGNKRASKGDVVQAKRGMSMMALGAKANEYFLPVYRMPSQMSNQVLSKEMYK